MKYNLDWLINRYNQEEKIKYLFFWGHQPRKDGSIGETCLSQWWEDSFEVEGTSYLTAEHWMMAEKARLFKDEEILNKILSAQSPGEAKALGRQVNNFQPELWDMVKYEIVKKGNFYKFKQNQALQTFLLNTQDRVIVEASPVDPIWGIGLVKDDPNATHPDKWKGLNLLGFALMEVRLELSK